MIISGNFIAINKHDDFEPFEDKETPMVIWFNINNIVALVGYKDSSRLIIDTEHIVTLKTKASNELIALMRSERDKEVHERFEALTEDKKQKLYEIFKSDKKLASFLAHI